MRGDWEMRAQNVKVGASGQVRKASECRSGFDAFLFYLYYLAALEICIAPELVLRRF